jgi:hypothetical protein
MAKLLETLKEIVRSGSRRSASGGRPPRRRDPGDSGFVGRSSTKDIEEAPPERAGELAGHAVERVET